MERLAMPPHARSKRPVSVLFISGGQGEWSVTIMSIAPLRRACQRASRLVGAGGFEVVEREGCGEVDDVEAEAVLAAETDHQADGF